MMILLLIVVFVFSASTTVSSMTDPTGDITMNTMSNCVTSLHELEKSLQSNPFNIESIDNGFFPPNSHSSLWVIVNIFFNTITENHNIITSHPDKIKNITADVTFQWISSPVFLYLGPEDMQLLSGVFIGHSSRETNIVLSPLCDSSNLDLLFTLNKLIVKLPQYSSIQGDKLHGYSAYTYYYNKRKWRTILEENTDQFRNAELVIVSAIVFSGYASSIGLMLLTPLMLRKLGILPFPQKILLESGQRNVSLFWGLTFASFFALLVILNYDWLMAKKLFGIATYTEEYLFKLVALPFPLPIFLLTIANFYITARTAGVRGCTCPTVTIQTRSQRCCLSLYIFIHLMGVVLTSLLLQLLSFHFGWFVLMIVTFPLQVGALLLNYLAIYFALSLLIAGLIRSCVACGSTGRAHAQELIGGSCLLFSISSIALAYYVTITVAGFHYRDGISAMMPSLAPLIFVGIISWAMSKAASKLPGVDTEKKLFITKIQQQISGIGDYYNQKLKDLPV